MNTIPRRPTSRKGNDAGLALLVALVSTPLTSVVYGLTFAKLWQWFVADTFHVVRLSAAQAIGLAMVVTYVTYQSDASKTDESALEGVMKAVFIVLIRSAFTIVFALIVKQFV